MKTNAIFLIIFCIFCQSGYSQWWPLNDNFVQWAVTPDARIIYVSTTDGNDATALVYAKTSSEIGTFIHNPVGPIKPYATIAAAKAMLRNGFPDILLFKRGDVFENQRFGVVEMYGRSRNERMQIGAYGSGARPRILTGDQGLISFTGSSASFLAISDLYAEPHLRTGFDEPIGVNLTNAPFSHVYLGNCHFHKFHSHLVVQDAVATGPLTRRWFWAQRNIFTEAYQRGGGGGGMYFERVDTISITGNLIHHNGWSDAFPDAIATGFSHNTYFNSGCRNLWFYQNIVSQASAVGGGFRCGGDIHSNVFLSNPTGALIGSYDQAQINWPTESVSARFTNNAILNPRPETFDIGNGLVVQRARDVNINGNFIVKAERTNSGITGISINRAGRVQMRGNQIVNWGNNATSALNPGVALLVGAQITDSIVFSENRVLQKTAYGRCAQYGADFQYGYFSDNHWFSNLDENAWFVPSGSLANWTLDCNETNAAGQQIWTYNEQAGNVSKSVSGQGLHSVAKSKLVVRFFRINHLRQSIELS